MVERSDIYRCSDCGDVVEVLLPGVSGKLCGSQDKERMVEQSEEQGMEKHVPIVEKTGNRFLVRVGSVEHPMDEDHFIAWIEISDGSRVYRAYLKPGDKPMAEFCIDAESVVAREYCTVHGLWKK